MLYQYIILSYGLTLGWLGAPTVEPSPTPESGDLQKPTVTIPDPFPHDNRVRSTLGYVKQISCQYLNVWRAKASEVATAATPFEHAVPCCI